MTRKVKGLYTGKTQNLKRLQKRFLEKEFWKPKTKRKKVYIYILQKTCEIYVPTEIKQLQCIQFMNPETPPLYEFLLT